MVKNIKCRRCDKTEPAMVRYNGHFMGWFCEEHRPDRMNAKRAQELVEAYRDSKIGLLRFPIEFNDKAHPFFKIASDKVRRGEAKYDSIVGTFRPKFKRLNRSERRKETRQSD